MGLLGTWGEITAANKMVGADNGTVPSGTNGCSWIQPGSGKHANHTKVEVRSW